MKLEVPMSATLSNALVNERRRRRRGWQPTRKHLRLLLRLSLTFFMWMLWGLGDRRCLFFLPAGGAKMNAVPKSFFFSSAPMCKGFMGSVSTFNLCPPTIISPLTSAAHNSKHKDAKDTKKWKKQTFALLTCQQ